MNVFQFFIICKRTNNANNATHYVKLGKKRRESSKRNYYIISPGYIKSNHHHQSDTKKITPDFNKIEVK